MFKKLLIRVIHSNFFLHSIVKKIMGRERGEVSLPQLDNSLLEFRHLFRLKNFVGAAKFYVEIPVRLLTFSDEVNGVKCLYGAGRGVEADDRLFILLSSVEKLTGQNRRVVQVSECLRISGLSHDERDHALKLLSGFLDKSSKDYVGALFRLSVVRFKLLELRGGVVDPLDVIIKLADCGYEFYSDCKVSFPIFISYGYHSVVYEYLDGCLLGKNTLTISQVESICKYYPEWVVDNEVVFQAALADVSIGVQTLRAMSEHKDSCSIILQSFDSGFSFLVDGFSALNIYDQDLFLRYLMDVDHWALAERLSMSTEIAEHALQKFNVRGFSYLLRGDIGASNECFLRVLAEDPSDNLASNGLRFVLPRLGRGVEAILDFRAQIGYGLKSSGRKTIRKGSEFTISAMMAGHYCSALVSKRAARGWRILESLLGDKFYNYRPLPGLKGESLFIIADEGVGDEIRTAQFYGFLQDKYDDVWATCDPRLLRIYEKTFPRIRFLPIRRMRKQTSTREDTKVSRLVGFDENISKYMDSDIFDQMQKCAYITFAQNLMFNYFAGVVSRPEAGAYLIWDDSLRIHPRSVKLKVGILWRSHLMAGMRKLMYLRVEDFAPLTQLEGVELWSIQHAMTDAETQTCRDLGINLLDDVDLFNDFEGMAGCLLGLDLLIGISSVPMELGAALGIETWMLGFSPENYYLRTAGGKTEVDQLTLNSTVVAPPWIDFTEPQEECVREVFDEVKRRLAPRLASLRVGHQPVVEG